jgi:hypothetical protein
VAAIRRRFSRFRFYATRDQLLALSSRVARLEAHMEETRGLARRLSKLIDEPEVQEMRRLNRRVAELIDVVQELLVPAVHRDDERLRRLIDEYSKRL